MADKLSTLADQPDWPLLTAEVSERMIRLHAIGVIVQKMGRSV